MLAEGVKDPTAAGWKRDPTGRYDGRYWDGTHWTEHVVDKERVRFVDPVVPTPGPRPARTGAAPNRPPAVPTPVAPSAGLGAGRRVPQGAKIGLVVAVVIGIAVALYSGKEEGPSVTASTQPPSNVSYRLGETGRTGPFNVIVYSFKDPQPPGEFLQPNAGTHYVSVDVQVANPGSRRKEFSYLLGFQLVDGSQMVFDPAFSDLAPPPPDGEIAPGQSLRGLAVFEVPDGAHGLRVRVRADLTGAAAIFTLS